MEISEDPCTLKHGSSHEEGSEVPSLIKSIAANEVADFDSFSTQHHPSTSMVFGASSMGSKEAAPQPITDDHPKPQSVSISMPPTPTGYHFYGSKTAMFSDHDPTLCTNNVSEACAPNQSEAAGSREARFYSQPMPKGALLVQSAKHETLANHPQQPHYARDTRFDSFKTWSGKLERQLTILRGKPVDPEPEARKCPNLEGDALPVDRYFDALEGPELDTLRPMEEAVLPDDKRWPFLLRFTVPSFGICLGISSQAILWKALATSVSTSFLHISLKVNLILWLISVALVAVVGFIYVLKLIFYFEAVRREYYHPIRVNFFFAPWISLLFLCLGAPPSVFEALHHALWYILMVPVFFLELKIYGQWMSGGQRRLSKVANPCNHLSVVGNFVGALLGASMGLKEGPLFFYAIGLAHYTVLFVTLYQRLPTNETLPKELHPVFFLFVAAPSVASMAWAKIQGSFDYGARITYFIALFLYFSLAVRVNFFRGFRFSVAWWAYTFPMTAAAIATIRYSSEVKNWFTRALAIVLCTASTLIVIALLVNTIIHAFVLHDLFPNDNAIAISDRPPMPRRKWFHLRNGSTDLSDIENYLKFASSDGNRDNAAPEKCVAEDTKGSSKRQDTVFGDL